MSESASQSASQSPSLSASLSASQSASKSASASGSGAPAEGRVSQVVVETVTRICQIAVPTSDIDPGLWTNELGEADALYASINTAVTDDTVYIESSVAPDGDEVEFALGDIVTPGDGPVVMSIRVKWMP